MQEAAHVAKFAPALAAPEIAWLLRRWLAAVVGDPTRPTVCAAIPRIAMQIGGSAALRACRPGCRLHPHHELRGDPDAGTIVPSVWKKAVLDVARSPARQEGS